MAERQQTGVAEEEVVGHRKSTEDQHQGEQVQHTGTGDLAIEDVRDRAILQERDDRGDSDENCPDRPSHRRVPTCRGRLCPHYVTALPRMPCGRTNKTTASNATTMRSPIPTVP